MKKVISILGLCLIVSFTFLSGNVFAQRDKPQKSLGGEKKVAEMEEDEEEDNKKIKKKPAFLSIIILLFSEYLIGQNFAG